MRDIYMPGPRIRLGAPAILMLLACLASGTGRNPVAADAASTSCDPFVPCADPRGCPDLVVDPNIMVRDLAIQTQNFPKNNCSVVEGEVLAGRRRLLLFTSNTPNLGPGDLVIGNPADHPEWFEFSACHGHYHFKEYADYRLWTPQGYQQWIDLRAHNKKACARDLLSAHPEIASQMISGHKQGFCVVDVTISALPCPFPVDPPKYGLCQDFTYHGQTYLGNQGLSVCWADEYDTGLSGQWIDITGLAAGAYILEDEVNAEHFFTETDYSDNSSAIQVTIPAP